MVAQLNFYVPENVEETIRREAKSRRQSISSYLARLVKSHVQHDQWQKDFFTKVVAGWQGDFSQIKRPLPEERDEL